MWTSSGRLRRFRRSACKALGGRLVPRARQGRERRIRHDVACDGQRHCRRGLKLSSADAALVHGHILPQIELIESQDIFVSPVAATSRFYVRHTRHHHRRGGSCSITPGTRGGPLPRGSLARRYGAHHVGASGKDRALQADPEQRVQGPGDRFRHFRGHGARPRRPVRGRKYGALQRRVGHAGIRHADELPAWSEDVSKPAVLA